MEEDADRTNEEESETSGAVADASEEAQESSEAQEPPLPIECKSIEEAIAFAGEAKEAGNAALKSADLPLAIEKYEAALRVIDDMTPKSSQPQSLKQNDLVTYSPGRFAEVDYVLPAGLNEYRLKDLYSRDLVMQKMGYEDVVVDFKRKSLTLVPRELFDIRLACLQNLTLVKMKLARASRRDADYEDVALQADYALAMDGRSSKALMRKGAALLELKYFDQAAMVLKLAATQTKHKDPEVIRLLEMAQSKGNPKGKGKGVKKNDFKLREDFCQPCGRCEDPSCRDPGHVVGDTKPGSDDDSDPGLLKECRPCAPVKNENEEKQMSTKEVSRIHDDDEDSDEEIEMQGETPRPKAKIHPRIEEQRRTPDLAASLRSSHDPAPPSYRQEKVDRTKDEAGSAGNNLIIGAFVGMCLVFAVAIWYAYNAGYAAANMGEDPDEL